MQQGGPAYIHSQGICPSGMWFERSRVGQLLMQGVIARCDDCTERYPQDTTYMIVGDDEEEEANLRTVERYEVVGYIETPEPQP